MKVSDLFGNTKDNPELTKIRGLLANWINLNDPSNESKYKLNNDGSVNLNGTLILVHKKITSIPFRFNVIDGSFVLTGNNLTSMKNFPHTIHGDFSVEGNPITSLEGAPDVVKLSYSIEKTKITSLHDIHKHINFIGGRLIIGSGVKSSMLGCLKINDLKKVWCPPNPFGAELSNLEKVVNIINKHLPNGDIVACQQELIEDGLEEYAKL